MSCKDQIPTAVGDPAGSLGCISQPQPVHPDELAAVDLYSTFLLPGRWVVCQFSVRPGFDLESSQTLLEFQEIADGIGGESVVRLSPDRLRDAAGKAQPADGTRSLTGEGEITLQDRMGGSVELPRSDWCWLIDQINRHGSDLAGRGWLPVTSGRQIAALFEPGCDELDERDYIRLQVIDQRRQIGSLRILLDDFNRILDQKQPERALVSDLQDGQWVTIGQDAESVVLRRDELFRIREWYQITKSAVRFSEELRQRLIEWQKQKRRIPSRFIARQIAGNIAAQRFPGSAYAQACFIDPVNDPELWTELLARQDEIDGDQERCSE